MSMTPMPVNPQVLVRVNPTTGAIVDVANNISPKLSVRVVTTATAFSEATDEGMPFNTLESEIRSLRT